MQDSHHLIAQNAQTPDFQYIRLMVQDKIEFIWLLIGLPIFSSLIGSWRLLPSPHQSIHETGIGVVAIALYGLSRRRSIVGLGIGITQGSIGRTDLLKPLSGFPVPGIQVRMMLEGQFAVGFLDFCLGRGPVNSQNGIAGPEFVVIVSSHSDRKSVLIKWLEQQCNR